MFTITSAIKNGRMNDTCRGLIANALRSMEGKFVKVTLEERKNHRSLSQNAFYWVAIIPPLVTLFREWGNDVDAEQVHEFFKDECGLSEVLCMPEGEIRKISGSSARLKTMEFEAYLERVRAWAAVWGVILPFPNEDLSKI